MIRNYKEPDMTSFSTIVLKKIVLNIRTLHEEIDIFEYHFPELFTELQYFTIIATSCNCWCLLKPRNLYFQAFRGKYWNLKFIFFGRKMGRFMFSEEILFSSDEGTIVSPIVLPAVQSCRLCLCYYFFSNVNNSQFPQILNAPERCCCLTRSTHFWVANF